MPAATRAVLLDGLGTLLALAPPWPALARTLRESYGLEVDVAAAEYAFRAEMAYYRAHHHEAHDHATLEELRRRCAEVLRGELPPAVGATLSGAQAQDAMLAALRFSAYPDAPAALTGLRARGMRLVVVSNWDVSLPSVLSATGLAGMLDGAIASATVGRAKPARAIFEAALALAGVPAERALHVGDSLAHDVLGARGAGIAAVLLRRASAVADGGDPPAGVPVISSLAELLA